MPITVNENGVLYELSEIYADEGGVLYELDTVHSNEGGVLHEIHSAKWKPDEIEWTLYNNATASIMNNGFKVVVSKVGGGLLATGSTSYGPICATISIPANTRVTHRFTNSQGLTLKDSLAPVGNVMIQANTKGQSYSTGGGLYGVGFESASDVKEEIVDYKSATTLTISLSGFVQRTYYTSSSSGLVTNTAYDPLGYTYEISFSKI